MLVGRVVLLVHHDHAQPWHRGEHRRAGAHHHARLAVGDAPVLGAAPGRGERAVQHRHGVAEAGLEAGGRLRRQRDLGHEHDRAASVRQLPLDRPQVDLGLARSGDTVQQHLVRAVRPRPLDRLHGSLLGIGQRHRPVLGHRFFDRLQPPLRRPRRHHQRDRAGQRRGGALGDPDGQIEQGLRQPAGHLEHLLELTAARVRLVFDRLHDTVHLAGSERHPHQGAAHHVGGEVLRHRVVERPVDRPGRDQRLDAGDQTGAGSSSPQASRRAATRSARSQVKAGSSRPKCP